MKFKSIKFSNGLLKIEKEDGRITVTKNILFKNTTKRGNYERY